MILKEIIRFDDYSVEKVVGIAQIEGPLFREQTTAATMVCFETPRFHGNETDISA